MRMYDIILRKKEGAELTDEEIAFFVKGYTAGEIPDYQASALCMAICFQGMSDREIVTLTDCMAHSGDVLDLSRFCTLSVDKHSTGGVGDKTSLIVTPIVAALGAKVAKMSGRGLGHTGGTVDKLESIPGYNTSLSTEAFFEQVEEIGLALIGQTGNLTPADKKLYALRDVTATVDSIPLITASIMSKKLAAGARNIVLDVKTGSGAFMKTPEESEKLARKMVDIGNGCGRRTAALITDMDKPLGRAVGNALEVKEAVEVLRGAGDGDLRTVCLTLAAAMAELVFGWTPAKAAEKAETALQSGAAYRKMREWIAAQGGDVSCIDDPDRLPLSSCRADVTAQSDGYVTAIDAQAIGSISVALGAGRAEKSDPIDYGAGIWLCKKVGEPVRKGEALCTLYTSRAEALPAAEEACRQAITLGGEKPAGTPLIYKVIR